MLGFRCGPLFRKVGISLWPKMKIDSCQPKNKSHDAAFLSLSSSQLCVVDSCDEQYFVNKTLVEQRLRIIDETLNHVPKVSCDINSDFGKTSEDPVDVSKLSNQTTRSVTDKTNINDTNAQTKNISKHGEKVNAARTDIFFKEENEEENNTNAMHYTSITRQEIADCRTEIKEGYITVHQ